MKTFRSKHPVRTYSGTQKSSYRDYRSELMADFNGRCGYTDCSHVWWGGGFHIDHFAPKKPNYTDPFILARFEALENDYSNLVYACPQVNRAKWNDWPSDDPTVPIHEGRGYLDPCMNFNDYFERTDAGGIRPKDDPIAKYMWAQLKLYLFRYELYWRMEQLALRLRTLEQFRSLTGLSADLRTEILEAIADLTREHQTYFQYLETNYAEIV